MGNEKRTEKKNKQTHGPSNINAIQAIVIPSFLPPAPINYHRCLIVSSTIEPERFFVTK